MYILDDVQKPNVFRNMFPYSEIPKIPFNDRIVPHNMPKQIWITDTTFRDGQQSRAPYTTEQIVTIYDYLHRLGGPNGMIRASEFFLYSKKDRDAVYKCMERGYEFPEVTSWIRASKEDFKLVKEIGMKETGILVSCSDYHIFLKLKMTRRQAMDHYLSVIKDCLEEGISPRCHLEDITRADIYGYVVPFCLELMKLQEQYKIPIKVRACDTMGYGVNYPGFREVCRGLFMPSTPMQACPMRILSGTDITISTRRSPIPPRRGCTAVPASTLPCSVSGREPEIHLWRRWCLSMHSCEAI